jgi:hypothetical protein
LYPQGVTDNDAGDGDSGPNQLINFPVIDSSVYHAGLGTTTVYGHLDHSSPDLCRVELFGSSGDASGHGQANEYLGFATPLSNGTFSFEIGTVLFWGEVTATATDNDGNTSEFSQNIELPSPNAIYEVENKSYYVFPNPANGVFVAQNIKKNKFTLELMNSNGEVLFTDEFEEGVAIVPTIRYVTGEYWLRLTSDEGTVIKSLIILEHSFWK